MNHLLNALKAFGIVLGTYLLLFVGIWAMLSLRYGMISLEDFGLFRCQDFIPSICRDFLPTQISDVGALLILYAFPFSVVLGALYLPPRGRLYAAIGAVSLIVGILIWFGIQIFHAPDPTQPLPSY